MMKVIRQHRERKRRNMTLSNPVLSSNSSSDAVNVYRAHANHVSECGGARLSVICE